jgi:hypothetical protein
LDPRSQLIRESPFSPSPPGNISGASQVYFQLGNKSPINPSRRFMKRGPPFPPYT